MKNSFTTILVTLTLVFAAFVGGFFIGRNAVQPNIEISGFSTTGAPATQPTQPAMSSTAPSAGTTSPTSPATDPTAALPRRKLHTPST